MVDAEEIGALEAVDDALMEAAKELKSLYYAEPDNAAKEKEAFMSRANENPLFTYRVLEYNPGAVEDALAEIEIPETPLGNILGRNRRNALLENRVIANRGNQDVVRGATMQIHGVPDERLVKYAEDLLDTLPVEASVKDVPAYMVKEALERCLEGYGLNNWTVELAKKRLTTSNSRLKKISVCEDRLFSEMDVSRLPLHEVGVHVLRAVNGYEQPLGMFALGLPGYLSTEEGLASFFEEKTGNIDSETQRSYAGRVVAVDSIVRDFDFRTTYNRLRDYKFGEDEAWNLSLRAHRAGGYIKDHVYLQGLQKVGDFARDGGDIEKLYVGKVGLDDLPLVDELLGEGFLKSPKYLPDFLDE